MIRINLLATEGRRPVAARQRSWAEGKSIDLGAAAFLSLVVVGLLAGLGHNFLLGRALENKLAEVAEAQAEVDELLPIIQEVEEFKAKKAELERKVDIVNDLKANQLGPVKIMDYVSRALPQLLWLNRMEVRKSTIAIAGEAFNTNAVANFIEALDKVPEFQEPVLKETAQRGQLYTFAIEFGYSFSPKVSGAEADTAVAGGG